MKNTCAVLIASDDSHRRQAAIRLAEELSIAVIEFDASSKEFPLVIAVTDDRLELREVGVRAAGPVFVDFEATHDARRGERPGRTELLLRAIDPHRDHPLVLDATAGLARDTYVMAAYGCRVIAVERSPVLGALVQDGLRRATSSTSSAVRAAVERIELVVGDAKSILATLPPENRPDVIYMDPMYPSRRRQVQVKKEMRVCRMLVGEDLDSAELLAQSRRVAKRHVVVKRQRLSPPLSDDIHRHYESKLIRFDVYTPIARGEQISE